jgi:flagellar assembly protein FliH
VVKEKKALSSRIIPKELLGGEVRKAMLDEFSPAGRKVRAAKVAPAMVTDGSEPARIREEAYRQGLAAGRQEAALQLDAERAALKSLSDAFQEMMQEFEQGLARDVLSMSLELSKLIVRQSLHVKPDLVLSVVREAVSGLVGLDEHTTVHLHPADAAFLREIARDDSALASLPWKIVDDAGIERGGCRLETATTEVDATLETRWRRVIAALGREDSWIDITL